MRTAVWWPRFRRPRVRCPRYCPKKRACRIRPNSTPNRDHLMRHKRGGYKLKRDKGARKSLFRGLVTSVIDQERVITTVPKAKAVQPLVDRMITLAKRDTLHTRRQAAALRRVCSVSRLASVIMRSTSGCTALALGTVVITRSWSMTLVTRPLK